MAEKNGSGREWLRTFAPYLMGLVALAVAASIAITAERVAPVEQRVAALEARAAADAAARDQITKDVREIRNRLWRWDDERRRGRFFTPDLPDDVEEKTR